MMKIKTPYILMSALAALFGCTKETEISSDKESIRYIGTIESVETRAVLDTDFYTYDEGDATFGQEYYLDQQNKIEWEVGDLVAIYTDEPTAKKTSGIYEVSGITDGTATFDLQTKNTTIKTDDRCNYAVYPYDAAFENGVFSYEIPDTYTYTDISSLIKKSLMVAKVAAPADETSTVELKFTNAQSILRLCFNAYDPSLYPQIKKIRLISSSNYLCGTAEVKWDGSTPPSGVINASKPDAGKVLTVTLETPQTIPHNVNSDSHTEVYLPFVPATFPEGDLTIELFEDGKDEPFYTKEIYKEVVVARGAIKGIKLTMGTTSDLADAEPVASTEELNAAIFSGKTNIKLAANTTYRLTEAQGKTLNITGPKSATLDLSGIESNSFDESTLTFDGIGIDWGSNRNYRGSHLISCTFNNCHIKGIFAGYPGHLYFNNCTLDVNGDKIWTYTADSVTFRNCDFYNTCQNAILMYADQRSFNCTLNIHDCHFFADGPSNWGENAVVEVKPHQSTTVAKVNFTGHNTKSKDLSWVRITARAGATVTVTVDGEEVDL